MKSVLISIHPKYCELTAIGEKTLEVRRTKPKLETPFKCYIYQTKKKWWYKLLEPLKSFEWVDTIISGRGKVIGEFVCDTFVEDKTFGHDALFNAAACMTEIECAVYSCRSPLYGWHISDLKIYDNPRDIQEFFRACDKKDYTDCTVCNEYGNSNCTRLNRPPQSWCYVEEV